MLILIGVAPTAYALNRTMPDSSTPAFVQTAARAQGAFLARTGDGRVAPAAAAAPATGILRQAIRVRDVEHPRVYARSSERQRRRRWRASGPACATSSSS